MVSETFSPARKGYPYAVTRGGLTYVFETAEEQAAFVQNCASPTPFSPEQFFADLECLDAKILERTGGKGVPEEAMQDALAAMRDH